MASSVDLRYSSPGGMSREMRLSPRCLLTPTTSGPSSGLSSPSSRCFSTSSGNNHSRQSSLDHSMSSALSSSFEFSRGLPPPPPPPPRHGRQGSVHSSTSAEINLYMSQPAPVIHSRQFSLDNSGSINSLRQKFGAQVSRGANFSINTPPQKHGPQFSVLNCKVSPTSLDLGYHTMVNEDSPSNSRTSLPIGGCRPKEKSTVTLDTHAMIASYKETKRTKSPKSSVPYFETLTDGIVSKIFSYLPTESLCACASVSKRFYFLAWEPSLWRNICFDSGEALDADFAIESVLKLLARDAGGLDACPIVERISLNNCSRLTDIGLSIISRRCPELRNLELKNCREITNVGVQTLATRCTSLSSLDLSGCLQVSTINCDVSDPVAVPSRNLYLRYLDLSDCTRLMDAGLRLIAKNSPHIQNLYLRRCVNVTDIGIKYLASHCLSLRELSISDCMQVTDIGLRELGKLGPNLRYLSVAKCEQVTDFGVKTVARLCYKLRYLNIRGCELVSDSAIDSVAQSCSRLRSLDIGKCDVTDLGLKALAENCLGLKKLSLKSCEMISDQGLQCIAYHCKGLQQLNIQDCPITLEGYRTIKKCCKNCIIEHTNPGFF